jgi:Ethanolamine utilization protein EutJ (predicted chaperonin)
MADAVTSQTLLDGERLAIMKFTNISDGTGESAVTKVNVSALARSNSGLACTGVTINKITSVCHGMEVRMYWDATTDVPFFLSTVNTNYENDFSNIGGITNNAGAGKNGNVVFSTSDQTAGDTYTVVLEMVKSYA